MRQEANGRWRARWRDDDGRFRSRTFSREEDALRFLQLRRTARYRLGQPALDTAAAPVMTEDIDPAAPYVYLLWRRKGDPVPLYVGSSASVLARLGTHYRDPSRRRYIGWVGLIRCESKRHMLATERELIRQYMPVWNEYLYGTGTAVSES